MRRTTASSRGISVSARSRSLALAALLVFAGVVTTEAFGVRSCPHHDVVPDAAAHVPHDADTSAAADRDTHDHGEDGPCRCVGTCHAGATSPGLVAPPSLPLLPAPGRRVRLAEPAGRTPQSRAFLLPWANGPPGALA